MLTISRLPSNHVLLRCGITYAELACDWSAALELAGAIARSAPGHPEAGGGCVVYCDRDVLTLVHSSGRMIRFPARDTRAWDPADIRGEVVAAIRAKARECEEQAKAAQIVVDGGLMAWMGLPCGLSNDPAIQRETRKEAELYLNREQRPPGGIEPRGIVGTPAVTNHSPQGA